MKNQSSLKLKPFTPEDDKVACRNCGKQNFQYVDCGAHGKRRDCQEAGCANVANGFAPQNIVLG